MMGQQVVQRSGCMLIAELHLSEQRSAPSSSHNADNDASVRGGVGQRTQSTEIAMSAFLRGGVALFGLPCHIPASVIRRQAPLAHVAAPFRYPS